MSTLDMNPCLPVPYLPESIFQYTTRQPHSFRKRPPKLQPKHDFSFNRTLSNSLNAHAISFKDDSITDINGCNKSNNDLLLSSIYNKDRAESYFDQCFEPISKIGEGSFGEVFKVRSKEDGLLYAVKKSKQLFRSERYRQERLQEVRRYEQFSGHEHCIKLHKAWEQDDCLYMQMELCHENLERYLSEKCNIPETKIWSILLDILLALKSLHDRNLIHLDVKLDNILIGNDGNCKLGDFGLVVDVDQANKYQTTEGDCRYIAPEVIQGYFSKSADVFSLGITMLELSCNLELPPNGPLWQELRMGILPRQFLTKISPELQNVIRSMMDPISSKRPTIDQLLSHKILQTLQQERKRWSIFRKFTNSYKRASRFIWTKVCNLKNIINHLLFTFFATLKFKEAQNINNKNDIDETEDGDVLNESVSSNNNPILSTTDIQFHSTPLNHSSISLRRSKKFSSRNKCSSNIYSSSDELNSNEFEWHNLNLDMSAPPLICKQLFLEDDSD